MDALSRDDPRAFGACSRRTLRHEPSDLVPTHRNSSAAARCLRSALRSVAPFALTALAQACGAEPDVVVYCALDQEHAEPILARFERETGLAVEAHFDAEANKTVGLVARLRQESAHTRCDVFWNNESAHSAALAEQGLLQPYDSPSARDVPERFRDPERRWTGFAARARVLIVNTALADPARITGWKELLAPEWAGRVAMARPLTGTTLTHFAALYELRGDAAARALADDLYARNSAGQFDLASGNATVMRKVRDGQLAFGWTDTDDFNVAREEGFPVAQVVPDQDGEGCLLIPNSVAILAGAPHLDAARKLVDFLLAPETESELARSRSAQIPLRPGVARPPHVLDAERVRLMAVDWTALGRNLERRQAELKEIFLR